MNIRRHICTGYLLMAVCLCARAQQPPVQETFPAAAEEEQLENAPTTTEDDARWQQLHHYQRHKLSLNTADAAALQSLGILTSLQINSLLNYRQALGPLAGIYELQAVPGFDLDVIRRLLPYVTAGSTWEPAYSLRDYMHKGGHTLLLRYGRQLEKARGYTKNDTTPPHYAGSPDQLLVRYRYSFPRHASWGLVMEKDAGEQLFKGAQRQGFDFYSAHLFIQNYRKIKALALGDFTVNMGQGLLNWQSLAFGKSPMVMQVKREGEVLRPYASAGEHYFFRGAGITLQQRNWQLTAFGSLRRLDGNQEHDSLLGASYVTSLVNSGHHRSAAENSKRGALGQLSAGACMRYDNGNRHIGVNVIYHQFSTPLQKSPEPYNRFAFEGRQLLNTSLDYGGSWKNLHLFGEAAIDGNAGLATVNGLLASLAPGADVALLYRYYHRAYQSLYSNAFGDHYRPVNESGIYMALSLRITPQLKGAAYADLFRFPWLRYRANAPTNGKDLLLALTFTPDKQTEAFIRYSYKAGMENSADKDLYITPLVPVTKRSWRCQLSMAMGRRWKLRCRLELNNYRKAYMKQQGGMGYLELQRRWARGSLGGRLAWFSTGGTNSSIYVIENNLLFQNSVSQLYGNGYQYNINLKYDISHYCTLWIRWNQLIYRHVASIGSGWDEVSGPRRSTLQVQLQHRF